MKRSFFRGVVSVFLILGLTSCFSQPATAKHSAPLPAAGKLVAPVQVDAEIGESRARVAVLFSAPGRNTQVDVWGVDGLQVKEVVPRLVELDVKAGESRTLDVVFSRGPGRSLLVVGVSGSFGETQTSRVVSFDVGTPTEAQLRGPGSTLTSGADRLHVMEVPNSAPIAQ
jgi:hypothetical protein